MPESSPTLRPTLRLWDLIFYGIVIITPIAPVPIFGVVEQLSRGHALATVLLAGVAMILTAFSYGRMAALYPAVGSAYTYVGRGLNPHLGFLAGWAMLLDYLVLPVVALIQAGLAFERLIPAVPYALWIGIFAASLTLINLRGIATTARTNIILLAVMSIVIFVFVVQAMRYLLSGPGLLSIRPFYNQGEFDVRSIAMATSFAALTYIGFDGVTTLAEEVENPRRNIPLATVGICLFTTVLSGLLVYLAQLIWPDYRTSPNPDTAFLDVTQRVGGLALFQAMGLIVAIASLGGGLSAQVAAARVLFAMGRDNVLPRGFFGRLSAASGGPVHNILFVGVLALAGGLWLNLEHAGELLNFGAFLAFMGVNLAALRHAFSKRQVSAAIIAAFGFVFCFAIWWNLPVLAKAVGGLWFLGGLLYNAVRTRGFRTAPANLDFSGG